ncbi:hypothetical protein J6590_056960 [Homalodisca vitripennis]|nr:hypothetical protein J6590_056960 [Homalodisca vitripennis]
METVMRGEYKLQRLSRNRVEYNVTAVIADNRVEYNVTARSVRLNTTLQRLSRNNRVKYNVTARLSRNNRVGIQRYSDYRRISEVLGFEPLSSLLASNQPYSDYSQDIRVKQLRTRLLLRLPYSDYSQDIRVKQLRTRLLLGLVTVEFSPCKQPALQRLVAGYPSQATSNKIAAGIGNPTSLTAISRRISESSNFEQDCCWDCDYSQDIRVKQLRTRLLLRLVTVEFSPCKQPALSDYSQDIRIKQLRTRLLLGLVTVEFSPCKQPALQRLLAGYPSQATSNKIAAEIGNR